MPNLGAFVAGGAAEGIGLALIKEAEEKKERALENLRWERRQSLSAQEHKQGMVRDRQKLDYEDKLIRTRAEEQRQTNKEAIGQRGAEDRKTLRLRSGLDLDNDLKKIRTRADLGKELAKLENELGISRDAARNKQGMARDAAKSDLDLQNRLAVVEAEAANRHDEDYLKHVRRLREIAAKGKELRKTAAVKARAGSKRTPAQENETLIKAAIKGASKADGSVDYDAAARFARDSRNEAVARFFEHLADAEKNPELWRQALQRAKAEASDKAGYFSLDSTDFKEDQGSEAAFISRRALEIYNELKGGGPKTGMGRGGSSGKPAAGGPAGSGTAQDPYQAKTQADVDWFKKNAKKGEIIVVGGRKYTKQ